LRRSCNSVFLEVHSQRSESDAQLRLPRATASRRGRAQSTGRGPAGNAFHGAASISACGLASASKIYACCWAMGPMTGRTVVFRWKVVTSR
jgi:hypothetical protein